MKVFGKRIGKDGKVPAFIDNFFGKLLPNKNIDTEEFVTVPSTNICDEEKVFEFSLALPGLDKKDVNVEVSDNYLIVSAHIEKSNEEKHKNWVRTEFVSNSFYRAFELPSNANPENIKAKIRNGRLDIKIGKIHRPEQIKRTIEIN